MLYSPCWSGLVQAHGVTGPAQRGTMSPFDYKLECRCSSTMLLAFSPQSPCSRQDKLWGFFIDRLRRGWYKAPPQARSNPVDKTYDRFDFEQAIMQCWGMVDDLKAFRKAGAPLDTYDALAVVYQQHFEHLWEIFEFLIEEGKLT